MSGFKDIIGQDGIIKRLKASIKNDNAGHAYIFEGEDGSGKSLLAETFAMALQCRKGEAEPCMVCDSCKKTVSKSHPDIIYITHEKPNTIGVDEIRKQLVDDILIKPYESRRKIYILAQAEMMTVSAQNALLKTLEEPPSYAVIILCTNNAASLLPTIISRCAVLRLKPLSDDIIKDYLVNRLSINEYQADIYASLSRGNIGKAKELTGDEGFNEIKNEAVRLLKNIAPMNMGRFVDAVKLFNKNKAGIGTFLDIFTLWYRDALFLKAGGDSSQISFKEELSSLKEVSGRLTYEGFNEVFNWIDKTRAMLNANINQEMSLELLFVKLSSL